MIPKLKPIPEADSIELIESIGFVTESINDICLYNLKADRLMPIVMPKCNCFLSYVGRFCALYEYTLNIRPIKRKLTFGLYIRNISLNLMENALPL